ncbi:MAG: BTAD domain-containing putative transcriptional regulator [Chloroflexota bacterium]
MKSSNPKPLHIRTLGALQLQIEGEPPLHFAAQRAAVLVVYLAVTGRTVSREWLATFLWDGRSQKQSLANLRSLLAQMPIAVKRYLTITRQTIAINQALVRLDLATLTEQEDEQVETVGSQTAVIEQTLTHYQGTFLEGVYLNDSIGLESWQRTVQKEIEGTLIHLHSRLIRHYQQQRRFATAIPFAERLLDLDPLHEQTNQLLLTLYSRTGRREAALRHYRHYARLLNDELQLTPSPKTEALHQRVRRQTAVLHRVPQPTTPYLPRPQLADSVRHHFTVGSTRLVTLFGFGGSGKTSLAINVANSYRTLFWDGVVFIELAGLRLSATNATDELATYLATAVQLKLSGDTPPMQQLITHLQQREMLLVLDNLEHLLPQASQLIQQILHQAPDIFLLATSRQRLNLQAELVIAVNGLPIAPATTQTPSAAVQLFIQRATRFHPELQERLAETAVPDDPTQQKISQLCQQLQGNPLAIELAAASLATQSLNSVQQAVAQTYDNLQSQAADLPQRQQSLRAVFQHSWKLLRPTLQTIMAKLTVFKSGFYHAAAAAVANATPQDLKALADASLLIVRQRTLDKPPRYELHELVRQYAAEKLVAAQEPRDNFRLYYATYLQQLTTAVQQGEYRQELTLADDELDNFRDMWQQALETRSIPILGTAVHGFALYYGHRGLFLEASQAFTAGIEVVSAESSDNEIGRLLTLTLLHLAHCAMCGNLGQHQMARRSIEAALKLAQETPLPFVMGFCWQHLAGLEVADGSMDQALVYYKKARASGQDPLRIRQMIAATHAHLGDYQKAKRLMEALLQEPQITAVPTLHVAAANGLGDVLERLGDFAGLKQLAQDNLRRLQPLNDLTHQAYCLALLGIAACGQGDYSLANEHLQTSLQLAQEMGQPNYIARAYYRLGDVALAQNQLEQAADYYTKARTSSTDQRLRSVTLSRSGYAAFLLGQRDSAQRFYKIGLQLVLKANLWSRLPNQLLGFGLLAEKDELAEAMALLALVRHHSFTLPEPRQWANQAWRQLGLSVSPAELARCEENGRSLDLQTTAQQIAARIC